MSAQEEVRRTGRGRKRGRKRANPERPPALALERSPARAVMCEAWQCSRAGSGRSGRLRFNSQWRQSGLQDGDLLVELCSKPRQPGSADDLRPGVGKVEWVGETLEAAANCTSFQGRLFESEQRRVFT